MLDRVLNTFLKWISLSSNEVVCSEVAVHRAAILHDFWNNSVTEIFRLKFQKNYFKEHIRRESFCQLQESLETFTWNGLNKYLFPYIFYKTLKDDSCSLIAIVMLGGGKVVEHDANFFS